MAIDRHPRARQAEKLRRKQAKRDPADRILIVSEGSKTEPNYFNEIRVALRLPTANICPIPCGYGTSPHQVVEYAKDLFIDGDLEKSIQPRSFEKVYAVFDRDEHEHYHRALSLAQSIQGRNYRNDQSKFIKFEAVASVPCFELWLLLHFENCAVPIHRDEATRRLSEHLIEYNKGDVDIFQRTKEFLDEASERAKILSEQTDAWNGVEPYTDVHNLVETLHKLKK